MDRRCLLIESRQLVQLRRDGPALRIQAKGRSLQWFPLRRISRVLLVDLPDTGWEALVQTAEEGIPVTFLSARGRIQAQLSHPAALPNPLRHWLEAMHNDPALAESYHHWLDNQLRSTYGMLGFSGPEPRRTREEVEKTLSRLARQQKRGRLPQEARQWFASLLTTQLQARARLLGVSYSSIHLQRLVDDLLPAGLNLAMAALLQTLPEEHSLNGPAIAHFYEHHLAKELDDWAHRVMYTLASQLEYAAMLHRPSHGRGDI